MGRIVELPEESARIGAPAELCFQVVAAAGTMLEERSDRERLVEFRTDLRGRELVTIELVYLDPPNRIAYRWVEGPLQHVEETIDVLPRPEGGCELRYRGRFETPHRGIRGVIEGWIIKRMFAPAVREHLERAKEIAESRAERSHVFRREE
jgi:hypothetical protein